MPTRHKDRTSNTHQQQHHSSNHTNNNNNYNSKHRGTQRYNLNKFENDDELKDYKSKIKNKYNIDYDHSLDEEYEIIDAIE
ncbi:GH15283 [Drosophila grimshawi]|uniref:GH15283 n=1 Tax=Drosophila grimshawi TaxID=7222 RepID=B4IWZ2_DROGR|nr:GH15283 [Drosophila grimshawi]